MFRTACYRPSAVLRVSLRQEFEACSCARNDEFHLLRTERGLKADLYLDGVIRRHWAVATPSLLYPQKPTWIWTSLTSAKCH
jgi:hypothetical protein